MTNRLEAVAVRKYTDRDGNEKTQYTNLGNAWPFRDKEGFTLKLNAFPAPQEGEYVILLVPPKATGHQRSNLADAGMQRMTPAQVEQQNRAAKAAGLAYDEDMNDDLPF